MTFNLLHGTYKNCKLSFQNYFNGNIALLVVADNGEVICKASVNLVDYSIPKNHILIKNWSENEGILSELIHHGIVEDTGKIFPAGFCESHLCKLLVDPTTY